MKNENNCGEQNRDWFVLIRVVEHVGFHRMQNHKPWLSNKFFTHNSKT